MIVEVVVCSNYGHVPRGQHGRGNRGAVAARAMHPYLACWDVVESAEKLMQRDAERALNVPLAVLADAAYVEDGDRAMMAHVGEIVEGGPLKRAKWRVRPVVRRSGGCTGQAVDVGLCA